MTNKVVFHIDELEKWDHTLGNIQNLIAYGQSQQTAYDIVVLVNGDAIMGYLVTRLRDTITKLQPQGVSFHACNNAMNSHGVRTEQLPAGVVVVPAGVADLIALQDAGYRYIKP
jgi:intracellular sulfur oxidation DsrE/DsrF family protein